MSRVSSMVCVLGVLLLGIQCMAYSGVFDCCYVYTKKPLTWRIVKGYVIQSSHEVCDIDAVIFITRKFRVCANPKDKWVNKIKSRLMWNKAKPEQSSKNASAIVTN